MRTVYVGYPRSSSHLKFLREICPKEEHLIILPDRNINFSDTSEVKIIGFFNRLRNRHKISQILKNCLYEKCILVMPFFFSLPRGGNKIILFEEGLSGYQKLFLKKSAISFKTKLKDLIKLILVKVIMFNKNKLTQAVVLGPNYAFGRKLNLIYEYFVTNTNALVPYGLSQNISKKIILFNKKRNGEVENEDVIFFILDPLTNNSKITFDIFIHFLNQKYMNCKNLVVFQLHPADFKNSEYIKQKFLLDLRFNFEFDTINDLDQIPTNYKMEGLNSSLLYYHRIINKGQVLSYAEEYAQKDKKYLSELLRRYGNQDINFLHE